METIYADTLVLTNGAIDYLLLLCAGKLCALPLRRWRMLLGAAWGGGYALLAVLYPELFSLAVVKLLAGAVAVVIAFGLTRHTLRALAAFYAVAAAFGGSVYAAAALSGRPLGAGDYLPVSLRILLLSFALCYAVICVIFRRVGKRADRCISQAELELDGQRTGFPVLEDTGNELTDPLTGCGVLVVEAEALAELFPEPELLAATDPLTVLERLNRTAETRFRLLSCGCVTAELALLLCFRPDRLLVNGKTRRDLIVAVSPRALSPDGEYHGIL